MPEAVPRVSVLLPVYNGGPYLADAVASVRAQTLADFELVAVDDGSTDGSGALLDGAAAADPRLRVLHQPNRGLQATLNRGLAEARAPLVARMDADDLSAPERLEKQVAAFEGAPETVLVSSNFRRIGPDGRVIGVTAPAPDEALAPWLLLFHNVVGGHSQVMFRRDAALAVGGYDEAYTRAEDYDLWCRLIARGRFRILPDLLLSYREHPGSLSSAALAEQLRQSAEVARNHIRRTLGLDLDLAAVTDLRRFWARGARRHEPPDAGVLGTLERNLRAMHRAFLQTAEGRTLPPAARARLRRRVAEQYLRWASRSAAARLPLVALRLALGGHALRWDPTCAPLAARVLAGRPLPAPPA